MEKVEKADLDGSEIKNIHYLWNSSWYSVNFRMVQTAMQQDGKG